MDISTIDRLLDRLPDCTVLVVGDFFLDDYLWLDPSLTEKSLETGLDAYQVVARRRQPGAAGTVVSNLRALGVGSILAVGLCGQDGEGYELRRALGQMGVDTTGLLETADILTPTYTKPMLGAPGSASELNRLDARTRTPLPTALSQAVIAALEARIHEAQAVIIADQVVDDDCGVISETIRDRLSELALEYPAVVFLVDSRARIGDYRNMLLKPNERELSSLFTVDLAPGAGSSDVVPLEELAAMGQELCRRSGRTVFATCGDRGMLVCGMLGVELAPGPEVMGPLDIVGAGDSATAGIVSALLAGLNVSDAAVIGNLVASVTVQKLGTTGTCEPGELRRRAAAAVPGIKHGVVSPAWHHRREAAPGLEIIRAGAPGPLNAAIFDFDGTLSLIREGWQDVMIPFMVAELAALETGESEADLRTVVSEFVFRLTGKQTIYQMVQLASEIQRRGGDPREPLEYKQQYHDLLWARIESRVSGLRSGSIAREKLLVPGSIEVLEELRRRSVTLILASGTDIQYVRDEADALGLVPYFGEKIFGALSRREDFSKRMVIERIIRELGLSGPELVAFGDGYVEIEDTRRAGGRAVGLATDEARPGHLDSWKRNRLISAGADIVAADFSQAAALISWLEVGRSQS